jgi:hypothetical protein
VLSQARTYNPSAVLIEEAASGISLIQDLRSELSSIIGRKPLAGDKIMRMNAQTAHIANGAVFLPKEASWLADYEHELMMFPKGRYADQVDSTSQALEFIFTNGQFDLEGWKSLMDAQVYGRAPDNAGAEPRLVRVRLQAGEIKANSGRFVRPDENGIFWLTEREAQGVRFMPGARILRDDE